MPNLKIRLPKDELDFLERAAAESNLEAILAPEMQSSDMLGEIAAPYVTIMIEWSTPVAQSILAAMVYDLIRRTDSPIYIGKSKVPRAASKDDIQSKIEDIDEEKR